MADTETASAPKEEQVQNTEETKPETNGDNTNKQDDAAAAPAEESGAVEVKAPAGDETTETVVPDTDASSAGKDKKRKSVGGVPEHKSKKLNKKKSMPTLNLNCKPGDYYWARLKGYPAWPSIIADEEMLPESLLATRPVTTDRADGTLRDDYKEGGKNAKDRTYPVMFLSTNEFAWLPNTSLTLLDPEECKNKPAKIGKALGAAYDLAAEHPDLDYFKRLLQQFQEETAALESQRRQKEAEAADKAAAKAERDAANKEKKAARKSKGGDEDVEMEDADAPKSSKKRKNAESDADAKTKKPPKITKLNAPKTNGEAKKEGAKTKKVEKPKAEKKPELTEAELLQQREKGVLYLRHRLQKAFLSSDSAPKEEHMSDMNEFFNQLEGYDELEPAIIRTTKIHKVLKAIIKLNAVPKDDEFNFKKRSQTMLEAWNKRMEANGEVSKTESKPATNGDAKVEPAKAEKQADEIEKKIEKVDTSELKKASSESVEKAEDAKADEGETAKTGDDA